MAGLTLAILALAIGALPAQAAERWILAEVTAYCGGPCARCQTTAVTADGTSTVRVPYNLASDRSLPLGARVFLPLGFGALDGVRERDRWFQVDDRGGALDTEARKYAVLRLDLRCREHWWAVRFGRKTIPVLIGKP